MHSTRITRNNPGAAIEKLGLPRRLQSLPNKRHGTFVLSTRVADALLPAAEFRATEVATT